MTSEAHDGQGDARIETGVPRFDAIVDGGFFRGSLYLMGGLPGSGKTIFANQVCFERARLGEASVFVTMLAESHGRMLHQIERLAFFRHEEVGKRVHYLSGFAVLEKKGLTGFRDMVRKAIEKRQAKLLVVDGVHTLEDYAPSGPAFRRFLRELQAFASLLDCAILLLSPHFDENDVGTSAMVDGVIELTHRQFGPRAVRELTVHKFRGSSNLLGRHEVEISSQGLAVHPRTEIAFAKPPASATEDRVTVPFGVRALDRMFEGGGVLSSSTTMLLGAPGTGKTVLGLQFLAEGAQRGEPGVYFGFYETPPRLVEKADSLGIPIAKAVKAGDLEIQWQPPLEHNLDSLAERLLERIHERKVDRLRLFVDGLAGFRDAAVYPDRLKRFFSALTHQLRELNATTLVSEETPLFHPGVELPNEDFASVVENIILLRHVEYRSELRRLIAILKSREAEYDPHIREFVIGKKGIEVSNTFASAQDILQGIAKPIAEAPTKKRSRAKASRQAPRRRK